MPKFLGFQICDAAGENIQGDDTDPAGLASFEIMSVATAATWIAANADIIQKKGFVFMPIFEGDIEEPTVV